MKDLKQTLVINIAGGPGCGKSIFATELFAQLKRHYVSCEISTEYIKKKLREKAEKVIQSQIYIFGKQQFQLFTLNGEVDVIITDSPLFFCSIYDKTNNDPLRQLILREFASYNNVTYLVQRDTTVPYEQEGRYQDSEGAKEVDQRIKRFLDVYSIPYEELNGIGKDNLDKVVRDILSLLKKN